LITYHLVLLLCSALLLSSNLLHSSLLLDFPLIHTALLLSSTLLRSSQVWLGTGEVFEEGECSLPPLEFETTALWIDLPLVAKKEMDAAGHDVTASIHAVNHVLVSISPLFAEVNY
jgi:hypothetical protein